jgi:hypothetical protein
LIFIRCGEIVVVGVEMHVFGWCLHIIMNCVDIIINGLFYISITLEFDVKNIPRIETKDALVEEC